MPTGPKSTEPYAAISRRSCSTALSTIADAVSNDIPSRLATDAAMSPSLCVISLLNDIYLTGGMNSLRGSSINAGMVVAINAPNPGIVTQS